MDLHITHFYILVRYIESLIFGYVIIGYAIILLISGKLYTAMPYNKYTMISIYIELPKYIRLNISTDMHYI